MKRSFPQKKKHKGEKCGRVGGGVGFYIFFVDLGFKTFKENQLGKTRIVEKDFCDLQNKKKIFPVFFFHFCLFSKKKKRGSFRGSYIKTTGFFSPPQRGDLLCIKAWGGTKKK